MDYFYDKQIEIMSQSDGYLDDNGVWHVGEETAYKTIDCDVQPYSKEKAYQDFGFTIECTKRVFCDVDTDLKIGVTVLYNENSYIIVKLIDWDDYYDIILNNQ